MMAAPVNPAGTAIEDSAVPPVESTPKKKGRTNTPWTAEEEQRLKTMRDAGRSWSEIAKVRTPLILLLQRLLLLYKKSPGLLTGTFFLRVADFPDTNRGQCQEALVQGTRLLAISAMSGLVLLTSHAGHALRGVCRR